MELASLEPFIETLDEGKKAELKEKLTEKYVGQKEEIQLSKDSIPAGPLMEIIKLLTKSSADK